MLESDWYVVYLLTEYFQPLDSRNNNRRGLTGVARVAGAAHSVLYDRRALIVLQRGLQPSGTL